MKAEERPEIVPGKPKDAVAERLAGLASAASTGGQRSVRSLLSFGSLFRETAGNFRYLKATKYGVAPLLALFAIDYVQAFDNAIFGLIAPEIRKEYNQTLTSLGVIGFITGSIGLIAGPVIGYVNDRVRRTRMVGISAMLSGVFSFLVSFAPRTNFLALQLMRSADEISESFGDVPTGTLLYDYYPVEARGRIVAFRKVAFFLPGLIVGPIVGFIIVQLGWRAANKIFAPLLVLSGFIAFRYLKEPVRGYWERRMLGVSEELAAEREPPLGWGEALRSIMAVRTLRRVLVALPVSGIVSIGFSALLPFYLLEQFHLNPFQRSLISIPASIIGLFATVIGGTLTDRLIRHRPGRLMYFNGVISAFGILPIVTVVFFPNLALFTVMNVLIGVAGAFLQPAQAAVMSLVIPARIRGSGLGIAAIFALPVLFASPIVLALADNLGIQTTTLLFAPLMLIVTAFNASAGQFFEADMRAAIASANAHNEYRRAKAEGRTKLLVCRDVDVHYGQVQVLFNVDFDVEEGQTIALLGTNGAGKSTLLRAISGIQEASNGAIVYDGVDITHKPPYEIARIGIVHMPGGRGVFPNLSVRENLDVAISQLSDQDAARARLEEVYGFFPRLRERIDVEAGLLSGGEQQQVALAQAFMSKPKLLVIDELSLGLSPVVVQELLSILRAMNAEGTTIILVEQSVNVALTVAERAIFMEKGEVKFVGLTKDLLNRPDIMRAVYLKGSSALTDAPVKARGGDAAAGEESRIVLEVQNLTKAFGGVRAVDDVSFDVREGEALGLVGPNGAGKTTVFDLISGFIPIDSGRVIFDGTDISRMSADARARLRLVRRFQDAKLFPSLTVFESICVALERKLEVKNTFVTTLQLPSVRKGELRLRNRADRLIEILELGAFRDKFVSELSTGLRRVVDLACVLASEPKVLLLDEPSSGIAQAEAESLGPLLRRVRYETGCSLLIIEHDMPLICAVSDELLALVQGRVVVRGRPDEVLGHQTVVEAYLGSSEEAMKRSGALPT